METWNRETVVRGEGGGGRRKWEEMSQRTYVHICVAQCGAGQHRGKRGKREDICNSVSD